MVEIDMPLEYRVVVARLYEQVECQLKMDSGFSKHFLSNMGVSKDVHYHPHSLAYVLIN